MKISYSDACEKILREDLLDELLDEEYEEDDEEMEEEDDEVFHAHLAAVGDMNCRVTEIKVNCMNAIAEYVSELRYHGYKALTELLAIQNDLLPMDEGEKFLLSCEYSSVAQRVFDQMAKLNPLLSNAAWRETVECLEKLSALDEIINEEQNNRIKGRMAV